MHELFYLRIESIVRFNTDNGIRRATIAFDTAVWSKGQVGFQYRQRYQEGYNEAYASAKEEKAGRVSIPTTVSGGLQLHERK